MPKRGRDRMSGRHMDNVRPLKKLKTETTPVLNVACYTTATDAMRDNVCEKRDGIPRRNFREFDD